MSEVMKKTYSKLMGEIEDLEDLIEISENDKTIDTEKLLKLKNELAEKREELARISDGCGHSHNH
jgi:hypothetical protein